MRILMVEDERHLAQAMAQVLEKAGFSVDLAFDGEYGLDCAMTGIYDVVILDIMLPKLDGICVLRRLRDAGFGVPVLLLTAKTSVDDKVRGLDCGADDYMSKPFETAELLARLRALVRRQGDFSPGAMQSFEDIELDPLALRLYCGGREFTLTRKESQLLELLIRKKGVVISKESIIEKLWGYDTEAGDSNVEVYISFLRKKLAQIQSAVCIQTIRSAGYFLKRREEEQP